MLAAGGIDALVTENKIFISEGQFLQFCHRRLSNSCIRPESYNILERVDLTIPMVGIFTSCHNCEKQEKWEDESCVFHNTKLAKSQRFSEFRGENRLKQRHF